MPSTSHDLALLAGWTLLWSLLHLTCGSFPHHFCALIGQQRLATQLKECYYKLTGEKKAYWRRLVRSQFYYFLAGISGLIFLYRDYPLGEYFYGGTGEEQGGGPWSGQERGVDSVKNDSVKALLGGWSEPMYFIFISAAAHWLVSFVEDSLALQPDTHSA